jgi:hypothetical protein
VRTTCIRQFFHARERQLEYWLLTLSAGAFKRAD